MENKKHVVISGGSGLIGQQLCKKFSGEGHRVTILTRSKKASLGYSQVEWNTEKLSMEPFEGADIVINLAGIGLMDSRWTSQYKKQIISSRINPIQTLDKYIAIWDKKPKHFISTSAVGIYGHSDNKIFQEDDQAQNRDFLVEVCEQWETAFNQRAAKVDKASIVRIGIVLSNAGGAYPEFSRFSDLGVVNYFGDGENYYSWIHMDDLCQVFYDLAVDKLASGIYNAVAPNAVTSRAMARSIKKWGLILPTPQWMLQMLLGEREISLTNSTHVIPKNLLAGNFKFNYSQLEEAIEELRSSSQ